MKATIVPSYRFRGGADSDCLIDLIERVRQGLDIEVTYAWMDTGLEWQATKDQIAYLEDRYGVEVRRVRAVKSIPTCVSEFGQPVFSKYVSDMIARLQRNGFQWEDEPLDILLERYPNCTGAIKWWCSAYGRGQVSSLDIGYKRGLKEFLVENHPPFRVSERCCQYAKKLPKKHLLREGFDLDVTGVRKFEGGVRSRVGKCFTAGKVDSYRPLYWFNNDAKSEYELLFGIRHSDCYTAWGFARTGCVGCPFNKKAETELACAEKFEPKMVQAARSVFDEAYQYENEFYEFRRRMDGQLSLF